MENDMTTGSPLKLILKFTIPLLLGNAFQQLYSMTDTVIVGKFISASALAAVGSTETIIFLVLGIAIGMTTGFSVITSQYYGAKNYQGVRYSVTNGILMSLAFSVVLTVISYMIMPALLHLMNTPEDIFHDALAYIRILCLGTTAIMFYNLFAAFLRAIGNSRVPLFFLIFSSCLNVILDLELIIVFHLGVKGAALATIISQGLSAALCAVYIYIKVEVLRPKSRDWRFQKSCCIKQLSIGMPMSLETGITASGTLIMQAALNIYGTLSIAGSTAAYKVINLMTQGHYSIGQAMASFAGQNFGAKRIDRIESGTKAAMLLCVIYSLITGLSGVIFLQPLIQLFFSSDVSTSGIMPWAIIAHHECAAAYIGLGAIFVYRSTLQGCSFSFQAVTMGIVELTARISLSMLSMHVNSYPLAIASDAAAWVGAGLFGYILYKKLIAGSCKSHAGEDQSAHLI